MTKAFTPMTAVPGARPRLKEDGITREHDRNGRPLWDMPKPSGYVENFQIVTTVVRTKKGRRVKKVKQKVRFPVYRGLPASLARYYRAQARRAQRKRRLLEMLKSLREVGTKQKESPRGPKR